MSDVAEQSTIFPGIVLRDEGGLVRQLSSRQALPALVLHCLLWAALGAAVFGLALGSYGYRWEQLLASALKVPILLLGATALCFPAFYVLQSLRAGQPLSLLQALAAQAAALSATAVVWAAFSLPLFFLVSTTRNYGLAHVLALGVGAAGGAVGLLRLRTSCRQLWDEASSRRMRLPLLLYFLVFAAVGAQLAWVLRPFIGAPSLEFQFIRPLEGNMFTHILDLLGP